MPGIESPDILELVVMGIALLMVEAAVVKHLLSRRATQRVRRRGNERRRREAETRPGSRPR